jgi:hypothetical protein
MLKSFLFRSVCCCFLFFPVIADCQVKFIIAQLHEPLRYGAAIANSLNTIEIPEYRCAETKNNCIYLKTGLRASKIYSCDEWTGIKDTVVPYQIDVVYSKYPLHNGEYNEIYPLLLDRLDHLFLMDPSLNNLHLKWNKVLQTHCISDDQVNTLFHGIVIWFHPKKKQPPSKKTLAKEPITTSATQAKTSNALITIPTDQTSFKDVELSITNIKNSESFPDSIKKILEKRPVDEQLEMMKVFLKDKIAKEPEISLAHSTHEELKKYNKEIDDFLINYGGNEDVVAKVFDRHPEWKNILVVNDWTGSMYGYGAQVLRWHLVNFKKSGIRSLTLFNDGDDKNTIDKIIGETGGIYSEKADNILKLVDLFNLIMLNGGGGDGPENDIEAILEAMDKYSDYSEIVLIADNNSCVRDIELADKIDKPIKIILCGYEPRTGINPDFVYLAKITHGGLYTVNEDIENIETVIGEKGTLISFSDKRFKLKSLRCLGAERSGSLGELYTDFKKANQEKLNVRRLDLKNQNILEIPKGIFRMKNIYYLNLNNNQIKELPSKINQLKYLKTLSISNNKIANIPNEINEIHYLESLNISHNELSTLPAVVMNMKFLITLNLSDNHINSIYTDNSLRKLEYLNISNNEIKEIPKSFGLMKKLKVLDMSNNRIQIIPVEITNLNKLEELKLENNQLTCLPKQMGKLNKLKILKLKGNKLSEVEKNNIRIALPETQIIF